MCGRTYGSTGIRGMASKTDSQATWRKSMRKLVQSYGLDALDQDDAAASDAQAQPSRFVEAVKAATRERFPAIGLGEDVRINGETIAGAALSLDGKLIHLVAFRPVA